MDASTIHECIRDVDTHALRKMQYDNQAKTRKHLQYVHDVRFV